METLSNFSSIYCFITFIMGTVFMFIAICVVAYRKDKEPRNKVHFYVTKWERICVLWFGKPKLIDGSFESSNNNNFIIAYQKSFSDFGLHINDYLDMQEEEIREVFLNLED